MKTDRLTREQWLDHGLHNLAGLGFTSLKADKLAKSLGVSRGSFYWHFKNRTEFLVALVEFWGRHSTESVIRAVNSLPESASAEEKLWELMCEVHELKHTRHELLIRSLALEYPALKPAIAAVDQKRFAIVKKLFGEMGFKGQT